jgi:hypothetical protein
VGINQQRLADEGVAYVGEMLQLRTEYQTLSRLPQTGQILFTVRTYVDPLANLVRLALTELPPPVHYHRHR